jgi:hypothetical protein
MTGDDTSVPNGDASPSGEPTPGTGVDPDITGALGIALGGPLGLVLGLKAEHDAQAQGRTVSWVPKTAVILGVLSLIGLLVGLLVVSSMPTGNPTLPSVDMNATTCGHQPKPKGPGPWYCATMNGYGTWISFAPTTVTTTK